ncbi:molybdopterin molybdotransferase MoeA [Helicobacter sp. 11S02596-1]|uniref:molybdopterin molybdotransferase MoeA n=1 Tax=Helicobacter sp. 11S02596-1 TaxID=1476194 RepID=UPI000BA50B2C|nr:molybdopterin molybdotransferase MoeA [Helicobacter sp. 11S02596-1]PAF43150.1 hypothetical protein BJI48_05230 [Helicobacter sp. 11S02596-1]
MGKISFQEAQKFNYDLPIPELEIIQKSIYEACGEILATDIICSKPLPAFDNSAMDGYAIKSSDLGKHIRVVGKILAGEDVSNLEVSPGTCVKIMTGAMIPKGVDVVVPFENATQVDGEFVLLPDCFKAGANIRLQGEEKSLGSLIAKKGEKLTYGLVALIASQGILNIGVYEKLKIGVYATGDEIIEPGETAGEHQIYNANSAGIVSLLRSYGHEVVYLGVLKDSLEAYASAMAGFGDFDVVITSGGASAGEADFLEKSLCEQGGNIIYHRINIKPGHPLMVAKLGKTIVFGLPGNPLSGLLVLNVMVIPALERLRKANAYYPKAICTHLKESLKLKSGRVNMVLGSYKDGEFCPYNGGKYGSGMIEAIRWSNAVALMGEGVSHAHGDIKVLPYVMEFSDTMNHFINE